MLCAMALACWGNYEGHHVEMDTIYLDGMTQKYDRKPVGSRGSNSKWDNDAHVCRNATTGDDFCFLVGDSKACGTTCNEFEVRGSRAYGGFNGRPVQGGTQAFLGGKAIADVRGFSVMNNFSSGDGPQLGVQVLLACGKQVELAWVIFCNSTVQNWTVWMWIVLVAVVLHWWRATFFSAVQTDCKWVG